MYAFESMGNALKAMAEEHKIWRIPVLLMGISTALMAIIGIGDDAGMANYSPDLSWGLVIPLVLIALALRIPPFYYPTRAYKLKHLGKPIIESELLMESFIGGLKVILVSIVYGLLAWFMALVLLIPAIVFYFLVPKPAGYVLAGAAAIPAVLFIIGTMAMMVPAYIWLDDFSAGIDVIGLAWEEKKETMLFGLVLLVAVVGLIGAASGIMLAISWASNGLIAALLIGIIDGLLTGLANALANVSGAEMFVRISGRPTWRKKDEVEVDPNWLASL